MLAYRIPLAGFASMAIFAVCFVMALILTNSSTTGRSRVFGLRGVLLVFASTCVQAVDRSLSSVYGTHSLVYQVGSVVVGALAAGGLVLLALAVARSRRAKNKRGDL